MATYYGNTVYPKEFKQWINNWLDDNNYKDYYVSDQQKEALFKASAHDEESEAWNEEVYCEIDNEIYMKKEGYFNWFKQLLMKVKAPIPSLWRLRELILSVKRLLILSCQLTR